jgi:hypothetical protein
MTRTLLAALGLIAMACSALAEQVKVIDRKTVAHGAQVVMELERGRDGGPATYYRYSYCTKSGIDWVFYREPVDYKKLQTGQYSWASFEKDELPEMKFNDKRISLFLTDWYDCIIATVELNPAAPKVYEDRFSYSYGYGAYQAELTGTHELVLTDPEDWRFLTKRLKRDREGVWWIAGIPYEKKLMTRRFDFTPKFKLSQVVSDTLPEASVSLKDPSGLLRITSDPFLALPDQLPPAESFEYSYLPEAMAKKERLKCIHRAFSHFNIPPLAPALVGGLDFPMPSMTGRERRYMEGSFISAWNQHLLPNPWYPHPEPGDDEWITAADLELPSFATDYERTVSELFWAYGAWKDYYDDRLLKSQQSANDVGFLTVIEWVAARAER